MNVLMRSILCGCLVILSPVCLADVSININKQSFHYDTAPRLNEVLANVAYEQKWYWPASSLFRLDTQKSLALRNAVIAKLKFIALSYDDERAAQIQDLIQQINSWQLADRVAIDIDYDRAQMDPNWNPRFDAGKYQLNLLTRPDFFSVFGLIKQPRSIPITQVSCAHTYIEPLLSQPENLDFVYLITPKGIISKLGIAYWNAGCEELMPGSQVFFPFSESQFFDENKDLNNQILELALNRIM